MPKTQRRFINPPIPVDREELTDYSATLQLTLADLFQSAHDHTVLPTNPRATDGTPQDIKIVDDGTNVYLAVKTSRGWFKGPNFTAI